VTDSELVAGIAAGDLEALEALVGDYHQPVLRYLWQAGGSKEDAEDLACQTLLKVRSDIAGFRGQGTLRSWIYRVAYRELLQHRRPQALVRWIPFVGHETSTHDSDDALVLTEALLTIPIAQRTAFLLTEVEGLSTQEASAALGIPEGTVKSRCHHARMRLRKLLAPTFGERNAETTID